MRARACMRACVLLTLLPAGFISINHLYISSTSDVSTIDYVDILKSSMYLVDFTSCTHLIFCRIKVMRFEIYVDVVCLGDINALLKTV